MNTTRSDWEDRWVHVLLEDAVGVAPAPDLYTRVLARAAPRRARARRTVAAAALLLVGLGLALRSSPTDPVARLVVDAPWPESAVGRVVFEESPTQRGAAAPEAVVLRGSASPWLETVPFALAVPHALPGGWTLRRARWVEAGHVRLEYELGRDVLGVWVRETRHAAPPRSVEVAGRRITVVRTGGLEVAFEGGRAENEIWMEAARRFLDTGERR